MSLPQSTLSDPKAETLEARLAKVAEGGESAIQKRLDELEGEWSIGRATKVGYGAMILSGITLGAVASPLWLALPAAGGLSLFQHMFSRHSWLATGFRGMGFRAGSEIEQEKVALKALRGDFRHLPTVHEVENRDDVSRMEGEGGLALSPEEAKPDVKDAVRDVIHAAKC